MKKISLVILLFLALPAVLAINLQIEKTDRGSVVIAELNNPAVYDFKITNLEKDDNFEIYSLVGVSISPRGTFKLPPNQPVTIEVKATPNEDIRKKQSGFVNFEYQIHGQNSGIFKDTLMIKIVSLKEVIKLTARPLNPDDNSAALTITNTENTNLENIELNLKSVFFDKTETISLAPHESKNLSLTIDKEKTKKIVAGQYIVTAEISVDKAKIREEGIIDYLEKEGTSVTKTTEGFIVRKTTFTKTNQGNVPVTANVEIKKDILSRLFTINSPSPNSVDRNGLYAVYSWEKSLAPQESLVVESSTNYTFPFIILVLIVIIIFAAKVYSQTALVLEKNVSFVKTRGGQFALKVKLHAKAKKHVENLQIIDTLPQSTKLYEKFPTHCDKIDTLSKRLFWNIAKLNKGEERVFSYIIYSNLNVVGQFELPAATAVFTANGKTTEAWSNRAFFVAEKS